KKTAGKKWTFMVYLAGDNNLDGNGVTDLGEMKKVGSNGGINLIAQFDRAGARQETKRFFLRKATTLAKDTVMKLGETDSGNPNALIDFVKWGVKTYPAERYALILWNHGGGWDDVDVYANDRLRSIQRLARGRIRHAFFSSTVHSLLTRSTNGVKLRAILYDDNAKDFLDNMEMKKVLAAVKKTIGRKLDILGMDACLMSMAEVAYQIRSSVRYAVGSEQTEPLDGWPYDTILSKLAMNPSLDTKDLSAVIVDKYLASYPPNEGVTQSACDLEKSAAVAAAIKDLAAALSGGLGNNAVKQAIMQARAQAQSYEIPENIDLADFCTLLMRNSGVEAGIKAACQKVIDTVTGKNGMVVKSGSKGASVKNSRGLAIYFPTMNISPLYAKLDFTKKSGWGMFLGKYLAAAKSR
ncbi:MAG: peptidase C11, partial [Proteobacteria bacterium]|nr:peptidase C11 [Pseudomonadota bacterium]